MYTRNHKEKHVDFKCFYSDYQRVSWRSDRDSNSGYAFGVYTLSRRKKKYVSI